MKSHSNLNLAVIVATDISLLALSWYVSHQLRFNFEIPNESRAILFRLFPFILMIKLVVFYLFDLYRGMWRYTSYTDLFKIIKATSVSSLVLVATIAFFYRLQGFSRAIFILDWILTIFLISGFRFSIRLFYCFSSKEPSARITSFCSLRNCFRGKQPSKRLLIIGAGDCGEKIFREIRDNSRLKYHLVGFIDDNEGKRGRQIHGVPILGTTEELEQIAGSTKTDEILIAIPTAAEVLMRSLVARCKKIGIPSKIAPVWRS